MIYFESILNKQLSRVTWRLRNLTSGWLILNWRASGGKTLHGLVSCVVVIYGEQYLSIGFISCKNISKTSRQWYWVGMHWCLRRRMVYCCRSIERKHWKVKAEDYFHQLKKDSQEGTSQVTLSLLSLCQNRLNSGSPSARRQKQY